MKQGLKKTVYQQEKTPKINLSKDSIVLWPDSSVGSQSSISKEITNTLTTLFADKGFDGSTIQDVEIDDISGGVNKIKKRLKLDPETFITKNDLIFIISHPNISIENRKDIIDSIKQPIGEILQKINKKHGLCSSTSVDLKEYL